MIDLSAWDDPQWTHDRVARYAAFVSKITFLLEYGRAGIATG